MSSSNNFFMTIGIVGLLAGGNVFAQTTGTSTETEATTTSAEDTDVTSENLLTNAELETMVAPVALYPDTLLIQILVASTVPLEVMKADRFVETYPAVGKHWP